MEQFDRMTSRAAVALAAVLAVPAVAHAQTPSATAYFEFLRGRHLESQGQIPQALEAYRLASEADPGSGVIAALVGAARERRREGVDRGEGGDPSTLAAHRDERS